MEFEGLLLLQGNCSSWGWILRSSPELMAGWIGRGPEERAETMSVPGDENQGTASKERGFGILELERAATFDTVCLWFGNALTARVVSYSRLLLINVALVHVLFSGKLPRSFQENISFMKSLTFIINFILLLCLKTIFYPLSFV